ncbi:hypothetical protein Lesp02_38730 [Lentzea sp. NBRC 105346]|uniref:alpha/beta hydrolase n=1 Tax=Lentzea sp. NBRC 105346 TaxID=3032205 RepID=UPI00249FB2B5|nr:alpha/beta hydrolase [Lentzea sp. NBRC 105346]GLZ31685.1 hypothetical protein Lesp02_38730 [Lentzea sp. NBRC 105346]
MSRETVPGHDDVRYHLLAYDEDGRERGGDSRDVVREAQNGVTDIFLFSHGWMGDVPAAREQYGKWLGTMADCRAEREHAHNSPGGFKSLLIGLHWPSKAWGDEEIGSMSFVAESARLLGGGAARQAAVRTIVDAAMEDAAPDVLPPRVREAYDFLEAADPDLPDEHDRAPFDAEQLYQGCLLDDAASFGGFSFGGLLDPLRVLTFWKMKKRARTFGEGGAAALVRDLQRAAPQARIHLMGHSFGCIVMSGAAMRADRPVATMALIQGAMSLWSYCSDIPEDRGHAGYFRSVVGDRRVTGPVLVTTSPFDNAVCRFYPLGARSGRQVDFAPGRLPKYGAIGAHGVRGPGIDLVDHVDLRSVGDLAPGRVHNIDARAVVATRDGIAGAHNDICHVELGRLVWRAVRP